MNSKKLVSVLLLGFVALSAAFLVYKEFILSNPNLVDSSSGAPSQTVPMTAQSKIVAYYFHGTYRCPTCLAIEKHSREAIEQYFPTELQRGMLEFHVVNVETLEHRHYIQEYQLYGPSLILVLFESGRRKKYKNLTDVLYQGKIRTFEEFSRYIRDEVQELLREVE